MMQSEWQQALLSYLVFIPKEKITETYTKLVEKQAIKITTDAIISIPYTSTPVSPLYTCLLVYFLTWK